MKNEYKLELYLVNEFKNFIEDKNNIFKIKKYYSEFNYQNGRVDIIACNNNSDLLAFEAKLYKWRIAMNQAYRATAFAHYSYVVLPEYNIKNALRNIYEFEKRGVGLCSVNSDGINIHINAKRMEPIQPWLTDSAIEKIHSI